MKRMYILFLASAICFLLAGCGTMESSTENMITESPIIEATLEPELSINPSPAIEIDHFIGEYRDSETDKPGLGLQISKNEDYYDVEIEILGKYRLPFCSGQTVLGQLRNDKIQCNLYNRGMFTTFTISVEDDIATVTFLDDCWDFVHEGDTFIYHKISDIPYEQYNEWKKEHPTPAITEDDFIGTYKENSAIRSNLKIQRNEDSTFQLQFTIHGIYVNDSSVGEFVNDAIEFTFWHSVLETEIKGRITIENGYAVLTILSDEWKLIDDWNIYYFYKVLDISQDEQEIISPTPTQTETSPDVRDRLYEAFLKNEIGVANPYVEGMNLTVMDDKDDESGLEGAKKQYAYVDVNGDENPELIFKIFDDIDGLMYVLGVYDNELLCFDVFETHTKHIAFGVYNNGLVYNGQNHTGFEETFYTYTIDGKPMRVRYFTEDNEAEIAPYRGESPEWIDWQQDNITSP